MSISPWATKKSICSFMAAWTVPPSHASDSCESRSRNVKASNRALEPSTSMPAASAIVASVEARFAA